MNKFGEKNRPNSKLNTSKTSINRLRSKAEEISKSDHNPIFPIYNVFNDIYTDSYISPSISFRIQKELTNFCKKGQIQVDYNVFLCHMMKVNN